MRRKWNASWILGLAIGCAVLTAIGTHSVTGQGTQCGTVLWQDDFESYRDSSELINGSGKLNRWYGLANGDRRGVSLTTRFSRSGKQAALITMSHATEYGNADLYLKLPKELIQGKDRVAFEGWLAFDNIEAHRLILMCEFWTGQETHYGSGPNKLLASVVEYNGPDRTWNLNEVNSHRPIHDGQRTYETGMDHWYPFRLTCSFTENRQISFEFDGEVWEWENLKLYTGDRPLDYTMLEVNVRLYFPYDRSALPAEGLYAQVAVDDVRIVSEE